MKTIKLVNLFIFLFVGVMQLPAQEREVKLNILQTSDIHGNYYPYDFIRRREAAGGLARIHTFVRQRRTLIGETAEASC